METNTATITESGHAGKPGESTAAASSAASERSQRPNNLTPDGVASLLNTAFADPAPENTPANPKPPGEEVQPGAEGDETPPAAEQPETETPTETPESPAAPTGELPAAVLGQVAAWEEAGGALPPALQAIVDKRIGREVGRVKELETRATTAEAEVQRLTTELETTAGGAARTEAGGMDEKALDALAKASKTFQADARAYIGGYADDAQSKRVEHHMQSSGMDEKGLRRQLDEVNDWLTAELPQKRQAVQQFKALEAQVTPVVKARFASLEKKDSEEAKWVGEIARMMPELSQRTPAHKLAVGVYALGKVAWDHLSKASDTGDVIEALRGVLTRHVPITAKATNGKPAAIPGKAPIRTPTGSPIAGTRTATNGKDQQQEQASQELRENPTEENVLKSLKIALR